MSLTCFASLATKDLEDSGNFGETIRHNEIIEIT